MDRLTRDSGLVSQPLKNALAIGRWSYGSKWFVYAAAAQGDVQRSAQNSANMTGRDQLVLSVYEGGPEPRVIKPQDRPWRKVEFR